MFRILRGFLWLFPLVMIIYIPINYGFLKLIIWLKPELSDQFNLSNNIPLEALLKNLPSVLLALFAALSLLVTTGDRRVDRAYKYIERWNSDNFKKKRVVELLTAAREIKEKPRNSDDEEPRDDAAVVKYIRSKLNDFELKSELFFVLNFFEEMSMAIEQKVVDDDILKRYFLPIVKDYALYIGPWILVRQQEKRRSQDSSRSENNGNNRNSGGDEKLKGGVYVSFVALIETWTGEPINDVTVRENTDNNRAYVSVNTNNGMNEELNGH